MEKEFFVRCLKELFELTEKYQLQLTYFDYVFLLALQYFKEKKVDFVCLEVGLGGKLDSTNIVDPLISVVTSISLDHMEILGPTINHIARDKAGIIKPKKPVVLGPCLPEEIFLEKAKETDSPVFSVKPDELTGKDYNDENSRVSRETMKVLCQTYPEIKVPEEAISEGLKACQPCRLEYVDMSGFDDPKLKEAKVVLDVGHNVDGITKSMSTLVFQQPNLKIRAVYGGSEGKDTIGCLKALKQYASKIHVVEANHSRAKKIVKMKEAIDQVANEFTEEKEKFIFEEIVGNGNIASTLEYALKQSSKSEEPEVIIIIGSFFIMAETRKYLRFNDEYDPIY